VKEINFRDASRFYSGQIHQDEALDFLQHHTPPGIMDGFVSRWRSGRKNETPSHVSWHEKLNQLLEREGTPPERMDVETVYLLFAELLIHQSSTADPEYASRLLGLIAPKKKKQDYNWMD